MKQFGPFRLDTANECLWRSDAQIMLPPKPFAVLRYLVENPGRLITHDELLDALWPETFVQPQVLRTYMLDLRKALGDDAGDPRYIQTLPKRGYSFVAPVSDCAGVAPGVAQVAKPAGFVNRDEELARLRAEFERAAGGERRVVFVSGEAGIGKTALLDAFCRRQSLPRPVAVARGECVLGVGGKEEYYPVMEALGHLAASSDGEALCAILARLAPVWLARLGRQVETAVNGWQTVGQERMLGDLCGALEEFASGKLLILIFEDLHWADDSTLNLISALARRRAQAMLMVLATLRPGSVANEHPLKALKQDLLMRKLGAEIGLAPLGKTAVTKLLSAELRQDDLPPGLDGFVHQHSEGNPLFAIAILDHLITQRVLVQRGSGGDGRWELGKPLEKIEAGVPAELAHMVELEIGCLSQEEQRVLEAGSLMSIAFPAWAVAAALDAEGPATEEICDGLARRLHFVERGGQDELPDGSCSEFYVFSHELYREVLYQRQPPTRRARGHIRVAERLGELFKGREAAVAREMAVHFEAAGSWQRAAGALRAAGRHAERREAHAEAAELMERARKLEMNGNERGMEAAN